MAHPVVQGFPQEFLPHALQPDLCFDGHDLVPCCDERPHPTEDHNLTVYPVNKAPLLDQLHSWDFPIFHLAVQTGGNLLCQIAHRLFESADLFYKLNIPVDKFRAYFTALEQGYSAVPYHNRIHAADVLHAIAYQLNEPTAGFSVTTDKEGRFTLTSTRSGDDCERLSNGIIGQEQLPGAMKSTSVGEWGQLRMALSPLELVACYIAAAQHDFNHPARTNTFLKASRHKLASMYDCSVLEHHHATESWRLLEENPNLNFLENLTQAEFDTVRQVVRKLILSTDHARHSDLLKTLAVKVSSGGLSLEKQTDRMLAMQMCLKIADINSPMKHKPLCCKWTYLVSREFYGQGDEERALGLPISSGMDRHRPQLPALQISFAEKAVLPLLECCSSAGLLVGPYVSTDTEMSGNSTQSKCGSNGKSSIRQGKISILLRNARNNLAFWRATVASGSESITQKGQVTCTPGNGYLLRDSGKFD